MKVPPGLHVLGIRHHGPGSARAVVAALDVLAPAVVLVEGPPDADDALRYIAELVPPVALTVHAAADASSGGFWPYAEFSPEWQALSWAHAHGVPARFCDLPHALSLGRDRPREALRADPFAWLAEAAGHDDPERWWEDVVEHRRDGDPLELFAAVTEVMTALREHADAEWHGRPEDELDLLREAAMRQTIRAALKEHETVAVVCGAWHAPVLSAFGPAAADAALLKGLPKVKTAATWVPWTHERLAASTGYGAGVTSPGWYAHLWQHTDRPAERWLARTSAVLRTRDLPASPASVVEAVRLAEALAALRGRALPGLSELTEATLAVLCHGDRTPLAVVARELHVGTAYGQVPSSVPTVPLHGDLQRLQRRLRLPATPAQKAYDLDLRKENDLERSRLLHRLLLLDVPWGTVTQSRGTGTFRESWVLQWEPPYILSVIDASRWGPTVHDAATAAVVDRSGRLAVLAEATALTEAVLLAELPDALPAVTSALDRAAAGTSDVIALLQGVPPLVRALRYGTVRGTPATTLQVVLDSLADRAAVNLDTGLAGLDEEGARGALRAVDGMHDAVTLLADPVHLESWQQALGRLARFEAGPGLLVGRATRLLHDSGVLSAEEAATRLSRALSGPPDDAVTWLEGFVKGSVVLLLHEAALFQLLDSWLAGLSAEAFHEVLPLLRRAFAGFTSSERHQIGERAAAGRAVVPAGRALEGLDLVAGAGVLARVRDVLGYS